MEKKTILSLLKNVQKPEKMRYNDEKDYNTKICKRCGEKWCYKRWTVREDDDKYTLVESTSNPLINAMITANNMNSVANAQKNPLYEPRIAKFINDFGDHHYCFIGKNTGIFAGYKFVLKDDRILYMFKKKTGEKVFIGGIGEKFLYDFAGDTINRVPITAKNRHSSNLYSEFSSIYAKPVYITEYIYHE